MISALLILSLLGAVLASASGQGAELAKRVAVAVSLIATLASGAMYLAFNTAQAGFQYVEKVDWLPAFGITYHVGLDGISLPFVFLTALLTLVSVLASWDQENKSFFALLLAMMGALIGVFASLDLILYFVAWEAVLIPMFFIIGVWGYENRRYAAIKFVLYSLLGS
ncbi:MAG TPA: proton-conducting transporter membrane subunit, partial [Deinococcales bacterium]|nr:proton-conducting transporter membrane subunit [Deinococcales bacterium]